MSATTFDIATREVFIRNTAAIVSSYVAQHTVAAAMLPDVIRDVFDTLSSLNEDAEPVTPPESEMQPEPAMQQATVIDPKRSVFPDHLVCLEDGAQLVTLKRHLMTSHNMTPDEYRAKWGLPPSYPMTAPNYANLRSDVAKRSARGRASWITSPQRLPAR
jgi:predicted transcriptional regulator